MGRVEMSLLDVLLESQSIKKELLVVELIIHERVNELNDDTVNTVMKRMNVKIHVSRNDEILMVILFVIMMITVQYSITLDKKIVIIFKIELESEMHVR